MYPQQLMESLAQKPVPGKELGVLIFLLYNELLMFAWFPFQVNLNVGWHLIEKHDFAN